MAQLRETIIGVNTAAVAHAVRAKLVGTIARVRAVRIDLVGTTAKATVISVNTAAVAHAVRAKLVSTIARVRAVRIDFMSTSARAQVCKLAAMVDLSVGVSRARIAGALARILGAVGAGHAGTRAPRDSAGGVGVVRLMAAGGMGAKQKIVGFGVNPLSLRFAKWRLRSGGVVERCLKRARRMAWWASGVTAE